VLPAAGSHGGSRGTLLYSRQFEVQSWSLIGRRRLNHIDSEPDMYVTMSMTAVNSKSLLDTSFHSCSRLLARKRFSSSKFCSLYQLSGCQGQGPLEGGGKLAVCPSSPADDSIVWVCVQQHDERTVVPHLHKYCEQGSIPVA